MDLSESKFWCYAIWCTINKKNWHPGSWRIFFLNLCIEKTIWQMWSRNFERIPQFALKCMLKKKVAKKLICCLTSWFQNNFFLPGTIMTKLQFFLIGHLIFFLKNLCVRMFKTCLNYVLNFVKPKFTYIEVYVSSTSKVIFFYQIFAFLF